MKLIYGVLSSALAIAACSSCSDDYNPGGGTSGKINPQLDLDANAITSRSTATGRDAQSVSVNDLKLRLSSADGSFAKEWNSISDFDNNELFKVGAYTIEAVYGDIEDEGFEKPYYYASAQLTVKENKVTPVSLNARLSNSMVSIATTDAFKSYFTNYSFQAHAEGGDYINYTSTETRPGYLRPGKVTVTADVTKPNGLSATLEAATFVAEPQHHYTVTIDVNNGQAGDAQLVITYDDMLSQEDVYIDLSDDILSAPAPEILAQGFDNQAPVEIIEGASGDISPVFFINAEGGIKSVTLTTQSTSLSELGWYSEIDLATATAAQQSKLKSLGLDVKGLFGNIDRMAQIDFTGVLPFIKYMEGSNNLTTFTITAKDNYNKISDPVSFTVKVEPIVINLSEDVTPNVGMTSMSVILNYNGTDVAKNVKIQYKNIRGTWTDTDITKVTATSDNNYLVEIDGIPANDATVTLRAVAGEKASDEITIAKGGFTIESSPNDIFATRARIVPTYFEEEIESAASSVKYEISENGSDYTAVNHTLADDGSAWISGLPAGKTLSVMATIGSKKAKVEITTETAAQIPNSDMEGWWREHGGSNWDFYYAYAEGTPQVWDTMNEQTTSSVGVGAAYTTTSGTKPATGVNGQCAVVRTVGWGEGNTAGGNWSVVNNITAGQLYLGKFKSVGQAPDYGYGFNSRPSELTFQAKYEAAKSDDFGSAEVRVLDASGNILASNSVNIGTDKSAWTEISLPLSYSANAAKASTIVVIFKSTAHSSGATRSYLKLPAFAANAKTESVGGQLYIDDIKLNY
ncbi:MAG: DUF4493 domain-containing protein [Muribaculaceae bacterium]|nr:DUF4493 domain-containing protein [Muribaculaceae bacterium]